MGNTGWCVLVVDDDVDVRGMLAQVLQLEGYDVVTAADGREALKRLEERTPALVLLDLMMPRMNGWQFRAEQLKVPALAQVPVVVLSGDGSLEARGLTMPGVRLLRKPIELQTLLDTVGSYCPSSATA